jgi:hypothetical protein
MRKSKARKSRRGKSNMGKNNKSRLYKNKRSKVRSRVKNSKNNKKRYKKSNKRNKRTRKMRGGSLQKFSNPVGASDDGAAAGSSDDGSSDGGAAAAAAEEESVQVSEFTVERWIELKTEKEKSRIEPYNRALLYRDSLTNLGSYDRHILKQEKYLNELFPNLPELEAEIRVLEELVSSGNPGELIAYLQRNPPKGENVTDALNLSRTTMETFSEKQADNVKESVRGNYISTLNLKKSNIIDLYTFLKMESYTPPPVRLNTENLLSSESIQKLKGLVQVQIDLKKTVVLFDEQQKTSYKTGLNLQEIEKSITKIKQWQENNSGWREDYLTYMMYDRLIYRDDTLDYTPIEIEVIGYQWDNIKGTYTFNIAFYIPHIPDIRMGGYVGYVTKRYSECMEHLKLRNDFTNVKRGEIDKLKARVKDLNKKFSHFLLSGNFVNGPRAFYDKNRIFLDLSPDNKVTFEPDERDKPWFGN